MSYIIYLTENLKSSINGINRIYVGVHKTENPEIFDGYLGCGVYINQPSTYKYGKTPFQKAVKKYGTEAFKRTTLFIYESEKEAYKKEAEIVDIDFLKQSHVYNAYLGGISYNFYKPLYQFDLNGILLKKWDFSKEAYDFYNIPMEYFEYAVHGKHKLLDCYWSNTETIDITYYIENPNLKITHLYDKNGKWIKQFKSRQDCANFIGSTKDAISKAISKQSLINKTYYVSDKMVDLFKPSARKQYQKETIYVYKEGVLIFKGIGKEIMPIIKEHSWTAIRDCFRYKQGWYKDFYLSFEEVSEIPKRIFGNKISVDVYDKYGNFIETLDSVKSVREKYKIHSSKIKNIELGDKYVGDWIFKYHSKKSK